MMVQQGKKLRSTAAFFLSFQFFLVSSALSAPLINSADSLLTDGTTVSLQGSGFGSHPDYNEGGYTHGGATPLNAKFKNFDDGSKTSGGWSDTYFSPNKTIIDGGRKPGGKYLQEAFDHDMNDERTWFQYNMSKADEPAGVIYSTFWFMMPAETQSGKLWRIYLNGENINSPYVSTGCSNRFVRGSDNHGDGVTMWSSPDTFGNGTWHRVEIEVSYGGTAYHIMTWLDGKLQWEFDGKPATIAIAPNGHTIDFGNMIDRPGVDRCGDHPSYDGSYNYDDIFVNYTRARLELCEGSSWEARGQCEVQIPLSWSGSDITAMVNRGTLDEENEVYLYVVDPDGSASVGYPVSFSPRPAAPAGLRVPDMK